MVQFVPVTVCPTSQHRTPATQHASSLQMEDTRGRWERAYVEALGAWQVHSVPSVCAKHQLHSSSIAALFGVTTARCVLPCCADYDTWGQVRAQQRLPDSHLGERLQDCAVTRDTPSAGGRGCRVLPASAGCCCSGKQSQRMLSRGRLASAIQTCVFLTRPLHHPGQAATTHRYHTDSCAVCPVQEYVENVLGLPLNRRDAIGKLAAVLKLRVQARPH